jgi:hypothetical protein
VRVWAGVVATAITLCATTANAQDYPSIFGGRYQAALSVVRSRQSAWVAALSDLGADPRTLVPVVFPELLRRSAVRQGMEDLGVATLYVSGGAAAADFSVGIFQMKPSFAEALEQWLRGAEAAPMVLRGLLDHGEALEGPERRALRWERLRRESGELAYLACFGLAVRSRFPLDALSVTERIRFLAAAYNHGFQGTRREIEDAEKAACFPMGAAATGGPRYRYADVSVDFYERYWKYACPEGLKRPENDSMGL